MAPDSPYRVVIAALILAAGASQRMGQPKALLSVGGAALLERVARTARQAGAAALVVVVGPPHEALIRQRFSDEEVFWAHNPQPERGMLSSVQAGLPQLPPPASGALIWPVDVPFVAVDTVRTALALDSAGAFRVAFALVLAGDILTYLWFARGWRRYSVHAPLPAAA